MHNFWMINFMNVYFENIWFFRLFLLILKTILKFKLIVVKKERKSA